MEDKNLWGRPSKYLEKTPEEWRTLIDKYIESCVDKKVDWKLEVNIPSAEGLCDELDIAKDTLYKWSKVEERVEFAYAIRVIKNKQGARLLNGGLWGQYNPAVVNRMLWANHWIVDKQEIDSKVEHSGKVDLSSMTIEEKLEYIKSRTRQ